MTIMIKYNSCSCCERRKTQHCEWNLNKGRVLLCTKSDKGKVEAEAE